MVDGRRDSVAAIKKAVAWSKASRMVGGTRLHGRLLLLSLLGSTVQVAELGADRGIREEGTKYAAPFSGKFSSVPRRSVKAPSERIQKVAEIE